MSDDQETRLNLAAPKYFLLGWICLLIGIACRALGYGQATGIAFPFSAAPNNIGNQIWLSGTLLEAGLVLLILGGLLVGLSSFFDLLSRHRQN
jgi:NADH:ubiquinone oxidoreductase subunit 2 (subunit N)